MTVVRSPIPGVLPDTPFPAALRAAIVHRGLALHRIKARLAEAEVHVGLATLSSWQNGTRLPSADSRPVLAALERLLELPEGWLTSRTGPGTQRRSRPYTSLIENGAALTRLLDQVRRRDAYGRTRTVLLVEELRFGSERTLRSKSVLQSVTAMSATDRQIVTHTGEVGADPALIAIRAVHGGRIGRVARDRESCAVLAEFLFDRPLEVGETAVLRYEVEDANDQEIREYSRFHDRDGAHQLIEMQFDPAALPVQVFEFRRRHPGEPDSFRRELRVGVDGRVHAMSTAIESGVAGLAWEWD